VLLLAWLVFAGTALGCRAASWCMMLRQEGRGGCSRCTMTSGGHTRKSEPHQCCGLAVTQKKAPAVSLLPRAVMSLSLSITQRKFATAGGSSVQYVWNHGGALRHCHMPVCACMYGMYRHPTMLLGTAAAFTAACQIWQTSRCACVTMQRHCCRIKRHV
jgi:hypothetical protein